MKSRSDLSNSFEANTAIIPAWLQSLHWRIVDIENFLQLPLQSTGTVPHLFASFCFYLLHYLGAATCSCTRWGGGQFCPRKKIAPDNLFYLYLLRKIGPPTCGCSSRSDGPFMLVEGTKEKKWEWKVTVIFPIPFASFSFYLQHYLGLLTCDCSRWSDGPFCPRKKVARVKKWEWKVTVIFPIPFASFSFYLQHYLGLATCDCARWSNGPFFSTVGRVYNLL